MIIISNTHFPWSMISHYFLMIMGWTERFPVIWGFVSAPELPVVTSMWAPVVAGKSQWRFQWDMGQSWENQLLVGGLEHVFFFSHVLGISSSQLTKSYFFRVGIPPTINGGLYSSWERHRNQWDTRWRPWHRHLSCFLGLVTFFSNMP